MSRQASKDVVFVSWAEDCSRSDSIAARLGGLSTKVYAGRWGSRYSTILFKYASQALKTFRILRKEAPKATIVMTPPVVACAPVWLYAKLTGTVFAIDAHTGAFLDSRWKRLLFLHRFFSRQAASTFVTNAHLSNIVRSWGAQATLVPDVPVVFPEPVKPAASDARYRMTFVSSFTWDEPLELFLEAAAQLPEVHFFITGRVPAERQELARNASKNVTFTGFLPRGEFAGLLQASDAVISLTTLDHTMQRAAYEAVYLGRPVITSRFALLEQEFNRGTVHVDNDVGSIVEGVRKMCANLEHYKSDVQSLQRDKLARWGRVEGELRELLLPVARS